MKQQQSPPGTPSTARSLRVRFLGTGVPYGDAMAQMRAVMANVDQSFASGGGFELLLLEHRDTITTTRQHQNRSFRKPLSEIEALGIEVIETDRGGDVTFHGAGQLVGYLVVRLEPIDLHGYLRTLEVALLRVARRFGLEKATLVEGKTGIWIEGCDHVPYRKLIAIGVGVSKGVTRHGFALNITTDLERFTECIVPCGLEGFGVTSLSRELGETPKREEIHQIITEEISSAFEFSIVQ